jgi:hypothetical protein
MRWFLIGFLWVGCATGAQTVVSSVPRTIEPPVYVSFGAAIAGLTACGDHFLVTADRYLWRVGVAGDAQKILKLQGDEVGDVFCRGDDYLQVEGFEHANPMYVQVTKFRGDSAAFRERVAGLMSGIDVVLWSGDTFFVSGYFYGKWYIFRTKLGSVILTEALAQGRFPMPCGDDCVEFITQSNGRFEVRRYDEGTESTRLQLGVRRPKAFVFFGGGYVVGYEEHLDFVGQDAPDMTIGPYERLVVLGDVLGIVRGETLEIVRPVWGVGAQKFE